MIRRPPRSTMTDHTLALHDALPIWRSVKAGLSGVLAHLDRIRSGNLDPVEPLRGPLELALIDAGIGATAQELRAAGEQLEAQADRLMTQNHQLGQVLGLAREVAGSLNLGYVVRGG